MVHGQRGIASMANLQISVIISLITKRKTEVERVFQMSERIELQLPFMYQLSEETTWGRCNLNTSETVEFIPLSL